MPDGAVVVLASLPEALSIAIMSRDQIEQGLGWGWTADKVEEAIRDPEKNVAVVRDGDDVVAFGVMKYDEDSAHLELLAVLPAWRRRALATAVLRWLEDAARVAGAERIRIECRHSNDAARLLYLENGYHEYEVEQQMYARVEDGIRLQKWLRVRVKYSEA